MANTDKAEPASSPSSQDGPESVTPLTSDDLGAHSPLPNSSHSTTPDHAPPAPPSGPASSAACSPFAIPHPKRFNAVNINKKFLQKNSSTSVATFVAANLATAAKTGSPAPARSTPLPSTPHSKLVTAKLTSTSQLSAAAGPGWSRPSSATPPVSATPSASPNAPPPQQPVPAPAAPLFPHAGKVIQPQPRNVIASSSPSVKKDTSTKSAWGNAKPFPVTLDTTANSDFPTAAEVAQGRVLKAEEPKPEDSHASKRVPPQEADAFRGVHLDPNAHHWDEMEEDDDNFLDNIIEFEDGRQYKVAPSVTVQASATKTSPEDGETLASTADQVSTRLVSKEERFADDFDRSWPRTRQSPTIHQTETDLLTRPSQRIPISPTPSQTGHSSIEGSRVLFNERSNRLEPYTNSHFSNRFGPNLGFSRRNTHGEPPFSPADSRLVRDALPHSPVHSVHLLQKPSEGSHDTLAQLPKNYDGEPLRNADRSGGPHTSGGDYRQSRVRTRDTGAASAFLHDFRNVNERRHRRLSNASFSSSIPDGQQQGSSLSSDIPYSRRSQTSRSPLQHLPVLPVNVTPQVSRGPQLPGSSHVSAPESQLPGTSSVLDIEGVHKTAMHISAERAKQRRQLEEEEREKEKERARKKAAELEARMIAQKATSTESNKEVDTSVHGSNDSPNDLDDHTPPEAVREREQSPMLPQRDLKPPLSMASVGDPLPPSQQVDSWRSKTHPPPQQFPSPMFQEPPPIAVDDSLEVIDFSDLGKFMGEHTSIVSVTPAPSSYSPTSSDRHSLPVRPIASDFFDDAVVGKVAASPSSERHTLSTVPEATTLNSNEQVQVSSSSFSTVHTREHDSQRFSGPNGTHPFARNHSSPTAPHHRLSKGLAPFRQVTMSALDDVMSRIKGALDDMQVNAGRGSSSNETMDWRGVSRSKVRVQEHPISTRALPKEAKWLPPALRQPRLELDQEVFGATCCEPPYSPRPITLIVKLPVVRPVDPLPKRQLHVLKNSSSPIRFDTLSWDPPVDGMSRRDLSINDILFRRPMSKGSKFRYRVQLPRTARANSASLPRVNLPSGFPKSNAVSGRSKAVDDLPTWRRGVVLSATTPKTALPEELLPILNVTGCSPHPEPATLSSEPTVAHGVTAKSESDLVRQRSQPKLPAGSAVGFYRDPSLTYQDSKVSVNFTVTSELEESMQVSRPESSMLLSSSIEASPAAGPSEFKESVNAESSGADHDIQPPTLSLITQTDTKNPEESTERLLRTPASASFSTWTKSPLSFSNKESPARAPDPEHLRAVWSQAADKEQISAVNSLEGIADDLTALPFTIQEVKSEDGETPPPTSATVTSKISLHDVTRAFQQVPAPSNVSSHRPPPLSPPSTVNGPISRPPTFNYPTPLQAPSTAMRPHFATFSSPMLAHSPSPTVLYPPTAPSPIPRVPMNGHAPLYNQPMWVPVQTSQNNGAVRPIPSPYPTQMVAYPAPSSVHSIYTPGLSPQNVPPSVTGSAPPRPRGMPMLSPVMHPAAPPNLPMYNGSPVLMHPPAMVSPGHHPPYMNSGPSERGQGRLENMSSTPHMQQPLHSQGHIPPQPVYTHVPFSRPSW